jgi:hypothetical protein
MKKSALIISMLLISITCYSQTKKPKNQNTAVTSEIERESLTYQISVLTRSEGISLDDFKQKASESINAGNASLIVKKNKSVILNYIQDINSFGESQKYFFDYITDSPKFTLYSFNNQNVYLQGGLIYNYSLNTLKLNADERAARVTKEVLMPGLASFSSLLNSPDINYFCLLSGYVVKDFSQDKDSITNQDGEIVAIVISKAVLKKYINAEITDDQVFKLASFYNSNKATKGIRKISVK